jgi:excisionase family DNA binding protein
MTSVYNLRAELHSRNTSADQLVDGLAEYEPVVSRSDRGWVTVDFQLPATHLRQAFSTGMALLDRATTARVLALEIVPTDELAARGRLERVPELVTITQAAEILAVSRRAVQQLIDTGDLPGRRVGSTWVIQRAALRRRQGNGSALG